MYKSMMEKDYWKQIIFKQQKKRELMITDNIEDLPKYDMSLISSEQYAMVVQGNALLGTALKNERDSKAALLKHIDDLEAALNNIVTLWDDLADSSDINEAITHWRNKFQYLFDGTDTMTGAELIAEDDGAEPPEHMTADDFNEMSLDALSLRPLPTQRQDGDEWWLVSVAVTIMGQ